MRYPGWTALRGNGHRQALNGKSGTANAVALTAAAWPTATATATAAATLTATVTMVVRATAVHFETATAVRASAVNLATATAVRAYSANLVVTPPHPTATRRPARPSAPVTPASPIVSGASQSQPQRRQASSGIPHTIPSPPA
jgi:hypothetical protein